MVGIQLIYASIFLMLFSHPFVSAAPHGTASQSVHSYHDSRPIDDDPMIGNKSFHQDPTRQMNQTVVDSDHNAQGIYCQTRKINKDGSRVWVTENRATLNCCKKISGNCVAISRPSPHALHFLEDRFCLFRTDDQRRKFQLCCSQDKFHYEIETPARVDLPCTQY